MSSSAAQFFTDDDIYLGFWTNWSHGRVRGATLTLNRRDGGLLVAFLALFVATTGTRFWRIGCFIIHCSFSSNNARDALYHQRQAILRNAANSTSGLWALLRTCWAWRRNELAPYRRLLPSALFALLTVMTFAVATIFSSEISTAMGSEVLLRGSNCGFLMIDNNTAKDYAAAVGPYVRRRTVSSMTYAQRCYRETANPRDCSIFMQPSLQWTADRSATCPFPGGKDICLSNSDNLRLDSGYIDSDRDLGINSPPHTNFLYRSVAECVPLKTDGYSENNSSLGRMVNNTYAPPNIGSTGHSMSREIIQYFYGRLLDLDIDDDLTYQYSADGSVNSGFNVGLPLSGDSDYTLKVIFSYADVDGTLLEDESAFVPIPDLSTNATDVNLFFLSANDIMYTNTEPCDDLWYAAHSVVRTVDSTSETGSLSYYLHDEPVRVLGCTTRYQFCNPDPKMGSPCTPLAGIFTLAAAADALWQTEEQRRFFNAASTQIVNNAGGLTEIVTFTGITSLLARHSLANSMQGPLPSNQWQLEVENWFGATMADLQRAAVEYATGSIDQELSRFLKKPQTYEEHLLCRSLKIRSDATTSFSVLGLIIVLCLGGLIILISFTIEPLTGWIEQGFGNDNYKQLEWATNEILQLQRLAHEELGCGTWFGKNFPITVVGEKLAVLDISDPDHPMLVKPALTDDSSDVSSQKSSNLSADEQMNNPGAEV